MIGGVFELLIVGVIAFFADRFVVPLLARVPKLARLPRRRTSSQALTTSAIAVTSLLTVFFLLYALGHGAWLLVGAIGWLSTGLAALVPGVLGGNASGWIIGGIILVALFSKLFRFLRR